MSVMKPYWTAIDRICDKTVKMPVSEDGCSQYIDIPGREILPWSFLPAARGKEFHRTTQMYDVRTIRRPIRSTPSNEESSTAEVFYERLMEQLTTFKGAVDLPDACNSPGARHVVVILESLECDDPLACRYACTYVFYHSIQ